VGFPGCQRHNNSRICSYVFYKVHWYLFYVQENMKDREKIHDPCTKV